MKIILITVASLLVPISIVASQFMELSDSSPVTFDLVDRNQNGLLSRQEAVNDTSLSVTFDIADANGDGTLDPHEYLQARRLVSSGDNHALGIWY
jgi:EF hand